MMMKINTGFGWYIFGVKIKDIPLFELLQFHLVSLFCAALLVTDNFGKSKQQVIEDL